MFCDSRCDQRRAGRRATSSHTEEKRDGTPGTINLIVITNACLAVSALICAVQVATESKTGVLRDHAVPSWTGRAGATGTGTDAVVIACALRGQGPWQPYAGTHTDIGAMIGRVTADCLSQGLARATQWAPQLARKLLSLPGHNPTHILLVPKQSRCWVPAPMSGKA